MTESTQQNTSRPVAIEVIGPEPKAPLADALKLATAAAHTRAEQHPLQARFVRGTVTRQEYINWLQQMLPIWRQLDASLSASALRDRRIADMLQPYHIHTPRILADLQFLDSSADAASIVPATQRFVDMIKNAESADPLPLLGIWYVLEGSANGGRYIAKALSHNLSIPGPAGLSSFDPHGEMQRERWQAWRTSLNDQNFAAHEGDKIIGSAGIAFNAVYDVMQDLCAADTSTSAGN